MTDETKLPITEEDAARAPLNENYGYDTRWFDLNNPNAVNPCVLRALETDSKDGFYFDLNGMKLVETSGCLWFKNERMAQPNVTYADVLAVIPKASARALHRMLGKYLADRDLLEDEEVDQTSGFTPEWDKRGLRG